MVVTTEYERRESQNSHRRIQRDERSAFVTRVNVRNSQPRPASTERSVVLTASGPVSRPGQVSASTGGWSYARRLPVLYGIIDRTSPNAKCSNDARRMVGEGNGNKWRSLEWLVTS